MRITELRDALASLSGEAGEAAKRIFHVSETEGTLNPPATMENWIAEQFGSVDAVRRQRIIRVTNLITHDGALFNPLRAQRPVGIKGGGSVAQAIDDSIGDPFCDPERRTPADGVGRIRGTHAITASNVAKYEGHHGVLVFERHDPLAPVDTATMRDYLSIARRWAEATHAGDPEARFYFLMWNVLWRAGASIIHGHMQMMLAREIHYPKVEMLRAQARAYRERYLRDYFDDLYLIHRELGLALEIGGARALISLTPLRDREIVIVGAPDEDERALAAAIALALDAYREMGATAHNLAVYLPPLRWDGDEAAWASFPPVVRLVDRGDPRSATNDVGGMELFAASVVTSDPFTVSQALLSTAARQPPY